MRSGCLFLWLPLWDFLCPLPEGQYFFSQAPVLSNSVFLSSLYDSPSPPCSLRPRDNDGFVGLVYVDIRSGALDNSSTSLGLSSFIYKTAKPGSQTQMSGTRQVSQTSEVGLYRAWSLFSVPTMAMQESRLRWSDILICKENPEIHLVYVVSWFENVGK